MIALQVLINIAVVTSSMPVTGMPLPFFSYGGTALMIILAAVGILLMYQELVIENKGQIFYTLMSEK